MNCVNSLYDVPEIIMMQFEIVSSITNLVAKICIKFCGKKSLNDILIIK